LTLIAAGFACKKYTIDDVQVMPWSPEIAFPLVNSTFSVSDIFEIDDNSILEYINIDEGLLGITYSGTILSYNASDIIEVSDQSFDNTITYPDPGLPISITDTIYTSKVFTFDFETQSLDGIEAKYVKMLAGDINLEVSSSIAYLSNIQIEIPYMKQNGVPYAFESAIEAGQSVSDFSPLQGYNIDLSQEDLGYNQLRINYRLIINYDPNTPPSGETLDILFHFNEPLLDNIIGYFGINTIAQELDTIKIELFTNTIQGQFQFIDPFMYLDFKNSFGFPTEIDITEFKSVNQSSGIETAINLEGLTGNPFEISYPLQLGDSTLDEYYFDNSNSNIEVVLNDGDKYVIWGIEASSNPNGPTNNFNFITHTSKLEVSTRLTIPLKGYAWDWVFSDTTAVDSGFVFEDPEEIQELSLRLVLNNGFPAEGMVQIYTLDSLNQVSDSLFDTPTMILESGVLVDGIITEPTQSITDILISDEKIDHFIDASSLITTAKMQTTNGSEQEVIQIYDYYSIQVMLGLRGTVKIDPESL
jgi:hypothetical protein